MLRFSTPLTHRDDNGVASGNNLGLYSIGMGFQVRATGTASNAIGAYNYATGDYALSLGSYSQATGSHSIAIGTTANATGIYIAAIGIGADTNGKDGAAVIGDDNRGINNFALSGVTLAGIKALEARTYEMQQQIEALKTENQSLKEHQDRVEALLVQPHP